MILHKLTLTNFGIYQGEFEFDLTPLPMIQFNRPLILFRGKNGVGKSTLVTALRVGLHGLLAFDNRTAQQEYDDFLARLVHRSRQGQAVETGASIEIDFDYVQVGQKTTYRVRRSWARHGAKVVKELAIWSNERLWEEESLEQKETFLRELIPPGLITLFFFDGEKIQTLAEHNEQSQILLAETVKNLLGLDTVEQLGKDLDLYITRQHGHGEVLQLQADLDQLVNELAVLEGEIARLHEQQQKLEKQTATLRGQITAQEQALANHGGQFAQAREARLAQRQQLETEMEALRRQATELCSGLFPFAIAPKMLRAVAARLEHEKVYAQAQIAQQVIEQRIDQLAPQLLSDAFWATVGGSLTSAARQALWQQISTTLRAAPDVTTGEPESLILEVAEKERSTLLHWIDQALSEVPQRFQAVIATLHQHEAQLARLKGELAQSPTLESLQPFMAHLSELHQQLGSLTHAHRQREEERRRATFRKTQLEQQRQRLHTQIAQHGDETKRVHLAARAQKVLEAYKACVTIYKISQIETRVTNRFNQLCRKKGFLERVQLDPQTFQVTLYRMGKEFGRQQLSAGESQLFAIAILWALREVSGRPLPVIVDTPLSRLDSEHRTSMIQEFFPFVSHQTLLLGTDIELDNELSSYLQPAISHTYKLQFDAKAWKRYYAIIC